MYIIIEYHMLKELHNIIYNFQKEVKELNNIQCMLKCLSYNSVIVSSYQANAHHIRIQYIEKKCIYIYFQKEVKIVKQPSMHV